MVSVSFLVNYAARAVRVHWKAVLLFIVLQTLFILIGIIPLIGIVGDILSTLLITSVAVFYGKKLREFGKSATLMLSSETCATNILFGNWNVSAGIILASVVAIIPLLIFSYLTAFLFGVTEPPQAENQTYGYIVKLFFFFLLNATVWSWYLYVLPYANGKAIVSSSFSESFYSFLKTFTSEEQFKTLNGNYFKFLFLSFLLLIVFVAITTVLAVTIIFSPIALAFVYGLNVYYGSMCVSCYSLITESEFANA